MKKAKSTKKKTTSNSKTSRPAVKTAKALGSKSGSQKSSSKVRRAASHLKKTTKKLVDDVFLKVVGMKVLARAQEITQAIKKEKRSLKKARR